MIYDSVGQLFRDFFSKISLEEINTKLFSVAITFIIFLILWRVGLTIIKHVVKITPKITGDGIINKKPDDSRQVTLTKSFTSGYTWIVWICCGLFELAYFVDVGALLAVAGVGTIAIGFGAQSLVSDLMSGVSIILGHYFDVDDFVQIGQQYGRVQSISVRSTTLKQLDGGLYTIYNGKIIDFINYSRCGNSAIVIIGVGYDNNLNEVLGIVEDAACTVFKTYPTLFLEPPTSVSVSGMNPQEIQIKVVGKSTPEDKYDAQSVLWTAIKQALDAKGIAMPYARLDVMEQKGRVSLGKNS